MHHHPGSPQSGPLIDETVREGGRRMLAAAPAAEVNQYRAELPAETDERGRRMGGRAGAPRHQRRWDHKSRNVSNPLPKSAQPGATKAMQETCNAEDRAHAEKAVEACVKTCGAKWTEAVAKITDAADVLPASYDFPAEHWVTLGAGSPAAVLALVFKLVESAPTRWRAITGAHLVRLGRAGAMFESGVPVERGTVAS
ncbi:hypothetical protein ABZX30_19370 [Streptomyces sp. NPDC004542]|uniref:hypothetical protein n=1 Tax=Streptomyces sp. NPDC004542 TaxID=3154281 RepID=UPI0033B958BB